MIRRRHAALALAASLLFAGPRVSSAQDTTQEKPTKITADAAFISTNGNTEVTTVSGGDKLEHKHASWLFTQEARAIWGETDGVETAGKYTASLRPDYLLSPKVSLYAIGAWRRDVFGGISRQFEESAGLSWHAVTGKPNEVDLEAGAGLLQRKDTLHQQDDFSTARAGARYKHSFTEKAYFEGRGSYLVNLEDSDDSQGDGSLALIAPIAGKFAMKLGYDVYYRNKPLPGLEKTDTTFSAGIQFAN